MIAVTSPDYCDCSPDYFDYDGLEDFVYGPDVHGFVGPDGYGLCRDFHDPGDWGDASVMPYESGAGGSGNIIAFRPSGSDQPVNCVLGAAYPGIPYEEDGLPRTVSA